MADRFGFAAKFDYTTLEHKRNVDQSQLLVENQITCLFNRRKFWGFFSHGVKQDNAFNLNMNAYISFSMNIFRPVVREGNLRRQQRAREKERQIDRDKIPSSFFRPAYSHRGKKR